MIFVVSLGDFDRCCYEDETTNRLEESLNCFSHFVNLNSVSYQSSFQPAQYSTVSEFIDKPCYVIFTKYDVLCKKVENGARFSHFPQETTDTDPQLVMNQIADMFKQRDVDGKVKKYFCLSALNEKEVKTCFNVILENVKLAEDGS